MITEPNNKLDSFIYKSNDKKTVRDLSKQERESRITSYGKKTYVNKLINLFGNLKNSGTSSYWVEVSE